MSQGCCSSVSSTLCVNGTVSGIIGATVSSSVETMCSPSVGPEYRNCIRFPLSPASVSEWDKKKIEPSDNWCVRAKP